MSKIFIANWKMYKTRAEALSFLAGVDRNVNKDVRIAASFTLLQDMKKGCEGLNILLGAQNVSAYHEGAYTGDVSLMQLRDVGAQFVLLGHSERRHIFAETVDDITKKVERAVVENMPFVVCVGETKEERDLGRQEEVLRSQLSSLDSLTEDQLDNALIAYEPVWAIGTGASASIDIIDQSHQLIQSILEENFGKSDLLKVLYGGSVSSENIDQILGLDSVGGVLVGSKSLDPVTFNDLVGAL